MSALDVKKYMNIIWKHNVQWLSLLLFFIIYIIFLKKFYQLCLIIHESNRNKKSFTTSKAKIPQYLILQENKNKKTARTQIMCIAQSNEGVILKKEGKKTIIRNLRKQKCIEKERKGGNWRGFVIGWGGQHQRKILPRTEDIKRREFLMSETIERGAKIFSTPDARFNYS